MSRGLRLALGLSVFFCLFALAQAASAAELPSTFSKNATLTAAGGPYTGGTNIEEGVTVTVEAGAEFINPSIGVYGTLDVEGTESEPVVFTGKNEEEAGEWGQIVFWPGSGASVVDHAEFAYGGNAGYYSDGTIEVRESSPTIENSTIIHSRSGGIMVNGGGSPEISGNQIQNRPGYKGISYLASPHRSGEVNIHGNYVSGGADGIYISEYYEYPILGTSLGENTVTGTTEKPIVFEAGRIPGDVTGNTLFGNAQDVIFVRETSPTRRPGKTAAPPFGSKAGSPSTKARP